MPEDTRRDRPGGHKAAAGSGAGDGLTRERALERFRSQQPEGFYAARADYIVDNGGGTLEPQIERICAELKGAVG